MMKYDVSIVGSGPGGYVSAIRCSQLGLKTAIIEKYNNLGGTCLNVGCIPSKALLYSSERYSELKDLKNHGIKITSNEFDLSVMIERKNKIVKQTCNGINYLMKKNKIDVFHGIGSFENKNKILITKNGKNEIIETKYVILATGSKPISLKNIIIDKKRIITSTEALNLTTLPKKLILIGGGVIAMEMGSVFSRLGSKVTVLEYQNNIIPTMDNSLGKELQNILSNKGIDFFLEHKVIEATSNNSKIQVKAEDKKGQIKIFDGDYCLVVLGRKAYSENLNLENIGLKVNQNSKIETNENLETTIPGIYAIGDLNNKGTMLAHKAEEEGIFVAEIIAGQKPKINYNLIPSVVYTSPEIADVGYTEKQLNEMNISYKVGNFPFKASGRARCSGDLNGFIKILADKKTDEILGIHMLGARVSDIISCGVTAMEFKASAEDLTRISFAHPTFSEVLKEACLSATNNKAIHI